MKILDTEGRILGKVSILDLGAGLVILLVLVGIFIFPGANGSVAQLGNSMKPIEVDLIVRGLSVRDPNSVLNEFERTKKTKVIIRNNPYGEIDIKSYKTINRFLAVPQPNGTIKAVPDPRVEESFNTSMLMTLTGKAKITSDGPVLGNTKVKIGTTVELEGVNYDFNASVIDIRY